MYAVCCMLCSWCGGYGDCSYCVRVRVQAPRPPFGACGIGDLSGNGVIIRQLRFIVFYGDKKSKSSSRTSQRKHFTSQRHTSETHSRQTSDEAHGGATTTLHSHISTTHEHIHISTRTFNNYKESTILCFIELSLPLPSHPCTHHVDPSLSIEE